MPLGPIRPRFRLVAPDSPDALIERLQHAVMHSPDRFVVRVLGNHMDITVARAERHRWSPCVQLEFRSMGEETVVEGLIGPHPNLWTLYAFVNFNLVVLTTFGLILGLVQLSLDRMAWALWSIPVGVLLLAGMYALSQLGRRFADVQTGQLMSLVEASIREPGYEGRSTAQMGID